MNTKSVIRLSAIVFLGILGVSCSQKSTETTKPNVLVIVADDLARKIHD